MNGYLLDTNVVSEVMRSVPNAQVAAFIDEHAELWLSSIVIHEIEIGIQLLAESQRRDRYQRHIQQIITEFEDRILPLDSAGAKWAASFRAQSKRYGKTLDFADALVAGTAMSHNLIVATRNIRDFEGLNVMAVNPWDNM